VPNLIAVSGAGRVYATDCEAARVYLVEPGRLTVIAGSGPGGFVAGFVGDGGPATAAQLQCPYGLAFDAAGRLLVADHGNQRIRMIDKTGVIATVAGSGPYGDATGGFGGDRGAATSALLNEPTWVAVGADGRLFISDRDNNRVRVVSTRGAISTLAGTGAAGFSGDGGPAVKAMLDGPAGLAVDAAGDLYVADSNNRRVRIIRPDGVIETIAGTGAAGSTGDGGPADIATLGDPEGLALDGTGNLFVGDDDTAGNRVRRIGRDGIISAFAGTGKQGHTGEGGPATAATLRTIGSPVGLAVDPLGRLYIADAGNHSIRVVSTEGIIGTLGP